MRIKDSFTSVRIQMPGRRIALASLVVAGCALFASVLLGMSPPFGMPRVEASPMMQLLPLIGSGLALLALLGSALCLFGVTPVAVVAAPVPAPDAAMTHEPSPALLAGLQAIVQELNGVLAGERSQVAALQQSCNATMQEAMAVSARVARMADAAIDAETRLSASVAQAEKTLRQPAAVVGWAAEATQRVERAIPELAELIKAGFAAASDPAFDAAAERLSVAVDNAVQTFRSAIDDAAGQISALGEISIALRKDAVALDLAGREIATAGATVVARAGEAVGQVDAALAALPDAVATVATAAEQVSRSLDDASAVLQADGATMETAGQEAKQAAGRLHSAGQEIVAERQAIESVANGIHMAMSQIAAVIANVDAVRADTAGMAELTEKLREAADVLANGTSSLDAAGRRVTGRLDYACEEIWAATDKMSTHVASTLAPLPAAVASVTAAADQVAHALTETLSHATDALVEGVNRMETAGQRVAERVDTTCEAISAGDDRIMAQVAVALAPLSAVAASVTAAADQAAQTLTETMAHASGALIEGSNRLEMTGQRIAERVDTAGEAISAGGERIMAHIATALAPLPEAAALVTAAADQAAQTLTEASAVLCADSAALEASGRETMQAAGTLLREAETLRVTGEAISGMERQAIATVARSAEAASGQLSAMLAEAEEARRDAASLSNIGAMLENVTATLTDGASAMDAAGQRIAAAGESLAERLAADANRSEAVLQILPDLAAEVGAAVNGLQLETQALMTAARDIAAMGTTTTAAITDIAARAGSVVGSLDATARLFGTAAEDFSTQTKRLGALSGQAEARAALLPEVAAQVTAIVSRLQAIADAISASLAAAPNLDLLETMTARLENVASQLPAELVGQIADAMASGRTDAAKHAEAAAPKFDQLEALTQRLETIVVRLPAEEAQEATVATLATLSGDISESVRRVEAALGEHDHALSALVASIKLVQPPPAAATPGDFAGVIDAGDVGSALAATLSHLDDVSSQTEMLLRQTEALAEAVMEGRAPALSSLLADRAPALLAGVEMTTQRLRSVATALALASDGPSNQAWRVV